MMSFFRRKPTCMTGEDLIKQLKIFHESVRKTFKDFEERFDILADIAKQAEKDSAEFRCQSCKGRPGLAPRQTVLSREDDQRQIAELKRELTKRNAEITELKQNISQKEALMDRKEEELRCIRSEKSKEADRVRVLETKTKELTTENNRLKDRSKEMEETISCTRNENKRLLQENQQLRQKLRKRIVVNTHTTLNASLSGQAVGELMSSLSTHLQTTDNVDLDQRKYVSGTECIGPVVAICINVSRLGTDVQEVLKNIKKDQQDIAVLVLHHKEAHALPNQNSDRILTGSEYKKLGAIIDVAFLSNKGMYPCEMNSVAMGRLVSFLLQYKTDIS